MILDSIFKFSEGNNVNSENLVFVAFLALFVNIFSLYYTHDLSAHGCGRCDGHDKSVFEMVDGLFEKDKEFAKDEENSFILRCDSRRINVEKEDCEEKTREEEDIHIILDEDHNHHDKKVSNKKHGNCNHSHNHDKNDSHSHNSMTSHSHDHSHNHDYSQDLENNKNYSHSHEKYNHSNSNNSHHHIHKNCNHSNIKNKKSDKHLENNLENNIDNKKINLHNENFNLERTKSTNENLKAMVIHLIFDVISSVIVVFSCLMIKYEKIFFFDPLCCLIVSIMILITTFPIFKKGYLKIKKKRLNFGVFFEEEKIDVFEVNCILNKRFVIFECEEGDFIYIDLPRFLEKKFQKDKKQIFCQKYGLKDVVLKLD